MYVYIHTCIFNCHYTTLHTPVWQTFQNNAECANENTKASKCFKTNQMQRKKMLCYINSARNLHSLFVTEIEGDQKLFETWKIFQEKIMSIYSY